MSREAVLQFYFCGATSVDRVSTTKPLITFYSLTSVLIAIAFDYGLICIRGSLVKENQIAGRIPVCIAAYHKMVELRVMKCFHCAIPAWEIRLCVGFSALALGLSEHR